MPLTKKRFKYLKNRLFLPMSYETSMPKVHNVTVLQMMNALLKGCKIGYVAFIVVAIVGMLIDWGYSAVFTKWLVEIVEKSGGKHIEVVSLVGALCFFGSMWMFGDAIFRVGSWYYAKVLEPMIDAKIKITYLDRTMKNSYEYFTSSSTGRITSGLYRVLFNIKCVFKKFARNLCPTATTCVILLTSLFFVHWSLGIITMLFAVCYFSMFALTYKKIFYFQGKATDAYTRTTSMITDVIMNFPSVVFFSKKKYEVYRAKRIQNYESKRIASAGIYLERLKIYRCLLGWILCCVLFYADAFYLYYLDKISISNILYSVGINGSCYGMLCMLHEDLLDIIADFGSIQEGLNIINEGKVVKDVASGKELLVKKGEISFKDLSFNFGSNNVFKELKIDIKKGEKVGLVGRSGAGKTTLVNLLLRNLSPTMGKILIDGQDIQNVSDESLKQNISIVSQDTTLFNRSVFENIRYAKQDATFEEVVEAAKVANAHDFIMDLEYGYETNVGEKGMRLSGGQRQRILIARAVLKNSPILVLDEATSALDAESEKQVQQGLESLMNGKTVIAIAHKLNTLKNLDRIIVLQKGKIIEEGTHNDLIGKQGSLYKELWQIQSASVLQDE